MVLASHDEHIFLHLQGINKIFKLSPNNMRKEH